MTQTLLFALVVLPFLTGGACLVLRTRFARAPLVIGTAIALIASAVSLCLAAPLQTGFGATGPVIGMAATLADFAVLAAILCFGLKYRNRLVVALALFQAVLLAVLELFLLDHAQAAPTVVVDNLSLVMVCVISVVGSLICVYALPYMRAHAEHCGEDGKKRLPRFFAVMLLFLGAMNGLVLAGNLAHAYLFFEITTLCSFLLIRHDATELAEKNAMRALLLNSVGGAAFIVALLWANQAAGTLDIPTLAAAGGPAAMILPAVALIMLASFAKSAQMPFQSWLLGAMVAPTPVSALLHSSTMVKAGVYLALRFAPAMQGSFVSLSVLLAGAFTFLAASALAVGQSHSKKVLAYSTIANLGLIFVCAGIGSPAALAAGAILVLFHAVSKALLFLAAGAMAQATHSLDIESMRGALRTQPRTALKAFVGILTMILPPFGVLLGKWVAIEAAARYLPVLVMLAVGSGLTMLFWIRWAGVLITADIPVPPVREKQPGLMGLPMTLLAAGAVILSLGVPSLFVWLSGDVTVAGTAGAGYVAAPGGSFALYPVFGVLALGAVVALYYARRSKGSEQDTPYLSGAQSGEPGQYTGPLGSPVDATLGSSYYPSLFGEQLLTRWADRIGLALCIMLVGGAL